jgi:hypothetical protein
MVRIGKSEKSWRNYLNSSLELENLEIRARFLDGSRTLTPTGRRRTNSSLCVCEQSLVYKVECFSTITLFQIPSPKTFSYNVNCCCIIMNIPNSISNICSYNVNLYSSIRNIQNSISNMFSYSSATFKQVYRELFSLSSSTWGVDRLCGLAVRVPGCRSIGPGSILGPTRFSEK